MSDDADSPTVTAPPPTANIGKIESPVAQNRQGSLVEPPLFEGPDALEVARRFVI
jgi:hypothetical protein